jgi:uncharacterized membrane protein YidH (DUF202 family)
MNTKNLGFFQALGVAVYCSLLGVLLWQGPVISPHLNQYLGPVFFLLLFSSSALICGLLVFYQPYQLFLAGKKKEALNTVVLTSLWLFVFLVLFLFAMIFIGK